MSAINPVIPAQAVTATSAFHTTREERQQNLQLHQMVSAVVVEGGDGRVMLEFAGRRVPAETQVPLQAGHHLDLVVVAISPRVELRIVSDGLIERLGHLLHLLGEPLDILPVAQGIIASPALFSGLSPESRAVFEFWMSFFVKSEKPVNGQRLKAEVDLLGLGHEGLLLRGDGDGAAAGLKNALLEARLLLAEGHAASDELERLLQKLELLQLCRIRLDQQHLSLVPFPAFDSGYMIGERGSDEQQETASIRRISLHLSLSELGCLRVDLLQDAEGLHIRFVCENRGQADFVAGFKDELMTALDAMPLQEILFSTGAEHPVRALLQKLLPEGRGVVNTRV